LIEFETSLISCSIYTWGFAVATPPYDKHFIRGMSEHVIAGRCRRLAKNCIFLVY